MPPDLSVFSYLSSKLSTTSSWQHPNLDFPAESLSCYKFWEKSGGTERREDTCVGASGSPSMRFLKSFEEGRCIKK
eukprot:1347897-Amorphochlora_amoeboformis.AAC.1